MKTAIIYYSMSGNTAMAAKKLAGETGGRLIEIRPEKTYPDKGVRKFLYGGKSAVMAETPKLLPYSFCADDCDLIILGFPVWASNIAPPIRSFVQENRASLQGKRIAAFACQSGSGGERAFRKLAECLGQENLSATMILIDPKDRPRPENNRKIQEFLTVLSNDSSPKAL